MLILRWGFRASNQLEDDSNVYFMLMLYFSGVEREVRQNAVRSDARSGGQVFNPVSSGRTSD